VGPWREGSGDDWNRRRPGRIGPFIDSYRDELVGPGYTSLTVRGVLQHVGSLGRWMVIEGIEPPDLSSAVLEAFVAASAGDRMFGRSVRSFRSRLEHLRHVGVLGEESSLPGDPLIDAYRAGMIGDRGLAPMTVLHYEKIAVERHLHLVCLEFGPSAPRDAAAPPAVPRRFAIDGRRNGPAERSSALTLEV
jgi:hypothetical protein